MFTGVRVLLNDRRNSIRWLADLVALIRECSCGGSCGGSPRLPFRASVVITGEVEVGHQEGGVHCCNMGVVNCLESVLALILRHDNPLAVSC